MTIALQPRIPRDEHALLELIDQRLARLDALVARATAVADQLAPLIATTVDTVDATVGRLQAAGVDPEERLAGLLHAADQLTRPTTLTALDKALGSGLLEPHALEVLGRLGAALASMASEPAPRVGLFGLVSALRDPDVQRATGWLVTLARHFGAALAAQPPSALPPASEGGAP